MLLSLTQRETDWRRKKSGKDRVVLSLGLDIHVAVAGRQLEI